ncbi:hypothetical protein [Desnuesiella massiliensis]|uniref:hypothetical protein n=1 Tax=Desnuesiella massiliensis TaxID=1650662 RepID=UPI0006E3F211|nr:hypothetical protein [Desnuesiella massiliensis]
MDLNSIVQNIATFTVGTISVSAVLVAISKRVFDKWLETRVAKYDYELKLRLEEYKLEKEKIAEESKIRFSKLHSERAEIIKELYKKLQRVHDYLIIYISELSKNTTNLDKFMDIHKSLNEEAGDFLNYANNNRIFFDTRLVSTIKQVEEIIVVKVDTDRIKEKVIKSNKVYLEEVERNILTKLVHVEIPRLKEVLEQEFRKILGVS